MQGMNTQQLKQALARMTGNDEESELFRRQLISEASDYQDRSLAYNQAERTRLGDESKEYIDDMHKKGMETMQFAHNLQTKRNEHTNRIDREARANNNALSGLNFVADKNRLDNEFFKI